MKDLTLRILAFVLAALLLAGCVQNPTPTSAPPTGTTAAPTQAEPTESRPTGMTVGPDFQVIREPEEIRIYPFTDQELQSAREAAMSQVELLKTEPGVLSFQVELLAFDPISTDAAVRQQIATGWYPDWTEDDFYIRHCVFTLLRTVSFDHSVTDQADAEWDPVIIHLFRADVDQPWQVGGVGSTDSPYPVRLRNASGLPVEGEVLASYDLGKGAYIVYVKDSDGEVSCQRLTDVVAQELQEMYRQNEDLVGWLSFPDSEDIIIDYPVMHHPEEKDFYLHANFQKEYSDHGTLYIKEDCDVFEPTDNVVIYGHNMRDGSMFAGLLQYQSKDFWEENQTFVFQTLTEKYEYQIIAVFITSGYYGIGYPFHMFVRAESAEDFNQFVADIKGLALYDTGVSAEYGDKLITLSTCEYSLENGRLVVVAKRTDPVNTPSTLPQEP